MISMSAASENANKMISELRLKYNSIRQNQITQEITEIVSAANAINNYSE
jgi:F-type H+-transporting ATPase subunit gamma